MRPLPSKFQIILSAYPCSKCSIVQNSLERRIFFNILNILNSPRNIPSMEKKLRAHHQIGRRRGAADDPLNLSESIADEARKSIGITLQGGRGLIPHSIRWCDRFGLLRIRRQNETGGVSPKNTTARDRRSQRMYMIVEMMKSDAKNKIAIIKLVRDFNYPPAATR